MKHGKRESEKWGFNQSESFSISMGSADVWLHQLSPNGDVAGDKSSSYELLLMDINNGYLWNIPGPKPDQRTVEHILTCQPTQRVIHLTSQVMSLLLMTSQLNWQKSQQETGLHVSVYESFSV